MDIAKYIGLFLEKNRFCNLPNLGEFKVEKKSATYKDGEIQAPDYNVSFSFSGGTIDDEFANFIAINERVSIASAANAIRVFADETKKTLAEGGEIVVPGFGKFIDKNGKHEFITDPNIKISAPSIPIFKINTEATRSSMPGASIPEMHEQMHLKEPTSKDDVVIKPPTVNWGKVLAFVGLILLILAGIGVAIWYFYNRPVQAPIEAETVMLTDDIEGSGQNSDSSSLDNNSTSMTNPTTNNETHSFGILKYNDKLSAEKKERQLRSYDHNVSIKENSDNTYSVVITIPSVENVESTKDSLRRFFNPKGTVIEIK
ncbi:MAG TPA: HU family DNA-binding protein [Edaphocola sp.]|nr:HU family DNA-binding protein [Edaphocola sp.]